MYAAAVIRGDVKNVHTVRTGIEYMMWLAEWYTKTAKTLRNREGSIGFFQIGGGTDDIQILTIARDLLKGRS